LELVPNPETNYKEHIQGIVHFLKITPTLSKTMIGEFLGVDKPLNKDCLMEFIEQYDLKGVEFVIALKTILQGFRLPGEG
jgi:Sec7-like guanine-nucleotide exchange factor